MVIEPNFTHKLPNFSITCFDHGWIVILIEHLIFVFKNVWINYYEIFLTEIDELLLLWRSEKLHFELIKHKWRLKFWREYVTKVHK